MRLALALILLAACGQPATQRWAGSPDMLGVDLSVQATTAWALRPDLAARARHVLETAAAYWSLPVAHLEGWRLLLVDDIFPCGSIEQTNGCTQDADSTVTISAATAVCVESSALFHEVGHIAIGDAGHSDPRWHDKQRLTEEWTVLHATSGDLDCAENTAFYGQW